MVPLSVRVKTLRTDRNITSEITDLRIRNAIPGGFSTASFNLSRPIDISYDDIQYYARVYVYDSRSGSIVWEGRLEDPGRSADEGGENWIVTAVGPASHAKDKTFTVVYVDRDLERWKRSRYSSGSNAKTETGEHDDEVPELMVRAEQGDTNITTSWDGDWIYRQLYYSEQSVARIRCEYICDGASSNYHVAFFGRVGIATASFSHIADWFTTEQTFADNFNSGIPTDVNVMSIRAQRDNSNTTADAFATAHFYNIVIRGSIKRVDGTDNFSLVGYNVNNIDPSEVVADLLGRALPLFDGPNALIIGSGIDIDQLAYVDGITADEVLADMSLYDPGFYWAAWESNNVDNRYRFEYRPWPTTVRYEADTIDGFDSPSSAGELYNRVLVRYLNPNHSVRNIRRSSTVKELDDAGIVREAYIDLSNEVGTASNATYTGDNFLLEHKYPLNQGTLTVSRAIQDNDTGRMVMPWELKAGNLIRVRGIMPRRDSLNPVDRDGVTIFRVISVEYDAGSGEATLELDTFSRTVARALADLGNNRFRKQ
jgi:hypothetical protein